MVTVELERDEWNHRVATHLRSFLARLQSPTPAGEDVEVDRILAMTDAEVISDAEARGEDVVATAEHCRAIFARASQSVAVRRAVQAALGAGLCPEDAVVLGAWVEQSGGNAGADAKEK